MIIVSTGKAFNDIDSFACVIAYTELLRYEGKEACAVLVGPLNHSVTKLALEQGGEYKISYFPTTEDQFVYLDLSDPKLFTFPQEDETKVIEIYDHHYGFEQYWKKLLGEKSHIERVGAAATLVWEEFKKRGFAKQITASSANLLALAILQNTLNFASTETNERDISAFRELGEHLTMSAGWAERYFKEFSEGIHQHFSEVLKNDTKVFENFFGNQTFVFSQLEIAENPVDFFNRYKKEIEAYWVGFQNKHCLINIPDTVSKISLLYSDDVEWFHKELLPLLPTPIKTTEIWVLIPLHQRKQILKLLGTR